MKRVLICADDYGYDAAISQGILDCVHAGMVTAASCMTLAPAWPEQARSLAALRDRADFGLHLDVNEFAPYAPGRSLSGWIMAAYAGQLNAAQARDWVVRQLDAFEQAAGFAPRYVDGHQHLHQLPVLRNAVLKAVSERYGKGCALRVCRSRRWRGAKAHIIGLLGAAALEAGARQRELPCNNDFAGVYDFSPARPYGDWVAGWLASLLDGGMLMTHPGRSLEPGAVHPDPIRNARVRERDWWLSEAAPTLLKRLQVRPVRFDELPGA